MSPGVIGKFQVVKTVVAAGHIACPVLGLVGSHLDIHFYLRMFQFMFMSPDATVAAEDKARHVALGACLRCLPAVTLVAVLPGWVIVHF